MQVFAFAKKECVLCNVTFNQEEQIYCSDCCQRRDKLQAQAISNASQYLALINSFANGDSENIAKEYANMCIQQTHSTQDSINEVLPEDNETDLQKLQAILAGLSEQLQTAQREGKNIESQILHNYDLISKQYEALQRRQTRIARLLLEQYSLKDRIEQEREEQQQLSTINVLGEVYEIIFENDIGLVNGVPISYKNSYILAEIFVFFLEKHPEFEREYDVCLAGHCLRAAHSDPFESNVSDSINIQILIDCTSRENCERWISILALQVKRFWQHVSHLHFQDKGRKIPFQIVYKQGILHINGYSIHNEQQKTLKFLLQNLKYLFQMQFLISEHKVTTISS